MKTVYVLWHIYQGFFYIDGVYEDQKTALEEKTIRPLLNPGRCYVVDESRIIKKSKKGVLE
jgi:hypothetical protein